MFLKIANYLRHVEKSESSRGMCEDVTLVPPACGLRGETVKSELVTKHRLSCLSPPFTPSRCCRLLLCMCSYLYMPVCISRHYHYAFEIFEIMLPVLRHRTNFCIFMTIVGYLDVLHFCFYFTLKKSRSPLQNYFLLGRGKLPCHAARKHSGSAL